MHRQHIEKKTCRALMIPKLAATAMSSDSDEFAEGGLPRGREPPAVGAGRRGGGGGGSQTFHTE